MAAQVSTPGASGSTIGTSSSRGTTSRPRGGGGGAAFCRGPVADPGQAGLTGPLGGLEQGRLHLRGPGVQPEDVQLLGPVGGRPQPMAPPGGAAPAVGGRGRARGLGLQALPPRCQATWAGSLRSTSAPRRAGAGFGPAGAGRWEPRRGAGRPVLGGHRPRPPRRA